MSLRTQLRRFSLTLALCALSCEGEALHFGFDTPLALSFEPNFVGFFDDEEQVRVRFERLEDARGLGEDPLAWELENIELGGSLSLSSFLFVDPFTLDLQLQRSAGATYQEQRISLQIINQRGRFYGEGVLTILPAPEE